MGWADYNEIIQREIKPDLIDTKIYKPLEPWRKYFNFDTAPLKGDRITSKYRLAYTSNAAFYDKSDVDPVASTQTLGKPYWTKVFSHGSCEVHGIDLSNDKPGGSEVDQIQDAISKETEALMDLNIGGFYTQIKKDVDSTSVAYSDAELSRSTYPLLVSYEEATDTTITLPIMRTMIKTVRLNNQVNLRDYICLCEESVYHTFAPLAAALHTWNINGVANRKEDMGYQGMANFEGLEFADPDGEFPGMTTGDVLMLRKQDVNVVVHRPLEIVTTPSGRDSIKMVLRSGMNVYVDNPKLQGKMTDKD